MNVYSKCNLQKLFCKYDYSSFMQQVFKATGLKHGSRYNSFGSKEALGNYTCKKMKQMREKIEIKLFPVDFVPALNCP